MNWKRDQYGDEIPDDLVLMPRITYEGEVILSDDNIEAIDTADWYEANGMLMVSAKAIDYLSEDDPIDAGIDIAKAEVNYVAHALHRWSEEDGFYHA